eukprot:1178749-Rhodomonas_salina.2
MCETARVPPLLRSASFSRRRSRSMIVCSSPVVGAFGDALALVLLRRVKLIFSRSFRNVFCSCEEKSVAALRFKSAATSSSPRFPTHTFCESEEDRTRGSARFGLRAEGSALRSNGCARRPEGRCWG